MASENIHGAKRLTKGIERRSRRALGASASLALPPLTRLPGDRDRQGEGTRCSGRRLSAPQDGEFRIVIPPRGRKDHVVHRVGKDFFPP